MNGLAIGALATGLMFGVFPVLIMSAGAGAGAGPTEPACVSSEAAAAPVAAMDGLSGDQLGHAATIIRVGRDRRVPDQGIVVALAAALQESRLRVYANDGRGGDLALDQRGIATSLRLPYEAVGTDNGSLGIFQQQWPWWGTMRELMDPAASAGKFYDALARVPGWQALPVTVAAQTVQRSGHPAAYADDEPLARRLLVVLTGGIPAAVYCQTRVASSDVVFPLPPGSGYVDQRNFGNSGPRWASRHTGTDLSAPCGTAVLAATSGTVRIDRTQLWAGPWLVKVSTGPGGVTTWYAHMQRVIVRDGARVVAGQRIGAVGALGNVTGCHLHFEVHPQGGTAYEDPVDPSAWLQRYANAASA